MSAIVRALEEDVFQLCERVPDKQTALEKQRLYSRVGQFLMGSFDGHWWCRYPTLMTFMVRILELHPGPDSVRMFYDKMAQQLGLCSKCVDVYHSVMPSVRVDLENEFTPTSVKAFFHKVSQLDAERIHAVFAPIATAPPPATAATFNLSISTALYEVLSNRRLWSDFRIVRVVSKWLTATPEPIKEAAIDKHMILCSCPGLLQWLVSPDPGIRGWATSLVGKFGIVVDMSGESSDGRAWMKVLEEWMYILESASFNTSLLNLDLPSTEELPMFLDVTNCVKTPTNQILWAALDTIMQRMNATSLEALLESFENLPDLVFNYLDEADPSTTNPQITFVICKCYGSLMRCLGHRYWNHTVHSPKVVLDLIIQHCLLPSWRVFVTKQLIDLLPLLIASMRPPTNSTNERNQAKLSAYIQARNRVLKVLLHQDHRPAHFNDQVLCVTASKAVSTLICDCYEPRLASNAPAAVGSSEPAKRDDGALPEMSLVDLSVIESSFWWPCGPGCEDIEQMWITHLFRLLVNPENVVSLVDHVATTCSTVLLKHLSLAREVVYSAIKTSDGSGALSSCMPKKPIVTRLLERLCAWNVIATIPIAVHGALFESVGGVAELLNVIDAQQQPNHALMEFKATLKTYETHVCGGYLDRISDEVLVKGLTNPIRFPVVAQHLTVCLLSPTSHVDQRIKRLLTNAGASKATPDRVSSPLESLLVVVHRNTEAYLRGVLSLLQGWRLHDFALLVVLPTVKKLIFTWTKMFEMLGNDIKKALEASNESSSKQLEEDISKTVNLQKVPVLIGDFLVRLLTDLYSSSRPVPVEEAVLIQCLDFGNVFWRFFTKEDKVSASSKRFEGMIVPLVRCIETVGGQAEKRRAAELLMTLLDSFVQEQTRINEASLNTLEAIKPTVTASIESKKATDFARAATKLRQITKASRFFSPRPIKAKRGSRSNIFDLSNKGDRHISPSRDDDTHHSPEMSSGTSRPMSGKGAAREQARLAAARSAASNIFETSAKKNHSFYDEDEFAPVRTAPTKRPNVATDSRTKPFNISQVVKGMEQTRPGARRTPRESDRAPITAPTDGKEDQEDEEELEEDDSTNLAPLFFKIKNTQKAIPSSPLTPFFRHLLQVCMPALLTKEFDIQRSDRELVPPPLTFGKSAEYANAFLPLLLEECHNEIQEGLRQRYFSSGKTGHLLRYESEKTREGMRCMSFSVVESSGPSAGKSRPSDKFFRREKLFRNADVVLLRSVGNRQNAGTMDLIGVIVVNENDREKRRQGGRSTGPSGQGGAQGGATAEAVKDDQDLVRVMFLNDGELESVTSEIPSFKMEAVTASAIGDTEWRVTTISNLVTAAREYVALRSVDMFPDHFRTTILTPNVYETTQTELLKITAVLDELRVQKAGQADVDRKILKLLKRLDRMDVTLTDLRSTSIGKTVNKLRKHDNTEIKVSSNALKDKWTALMSKKDALDVAPRYVSAELWDTIKGKYNQSQLQSIHSVLNNYDSAISLLQGPPGTGKTKTIMALLSGFLTLKIPPAAVIPQSSIKSAEVAASEKSKEVSKLGAQSDGGFSKFDLVREIAAKQSGATNGASTFSLSGTTAASRILRHTDSASSAQKPTAMQALRIAAGSARSRLEGKITGSRPSSASLVRQTLLGPSVLSMRSREASSNSANVLLCAPSNGAVDELVLRIVTDGLLDRSGKTTTVRAPSVHPDAQADGISILRLGNPGEDAPEAVKAVCLPHIIKHELAVHPKTIELRALQDEQRTLRGSIKDFYNKKQEEKVAAEGDEDKDARRNGRRNLAKTHSSLTQVTGKIRRLRDEVSALEAKMTAAILSSASIIACTLSKAGSGQFEGLRRGFDALIVDEAAQAVELSTLIPIRERVARAVLVGDPKQLPATVKSVVAANARYDRSLFERIAESGVAPSMLRVQYRMHPFLREFPSKQFYGGMLTDGPTIMERVNRVCSDVYNKPYFQPFQLYDLIDTRESDMNGSKYNAAEAGFCVDLCASLFELCPDLKTKKWSVGFVSPYREQVATIRKAINNSTRLPLSMSIEVNTVDGFQGREKDVIIFSCVRASDRGGIGFLKDIRRLNVGITRARFCLFVVGSVRTLRRDETWNALVQSAQERKLIIQATASGGFAAVKEELDRDRRGLKAHYEEMHEKLVSKKAATSALAQPTVTSVATGKTDADPSSDQVPKIKNESKDAISSSVKEDAEPQLSLAGYEITRFKRGHDASSSASDPVEKKVKVVQPEAAKALRPSLSTAASVNVTSGVPQAVDPARASSDGRSSIHSSSSTERSRSQSRGDRTSSSGGSVRDNERKRQAPPLERDRDSSKHYRGSRDDRRRSRSCDRPVSASRDPQPSESRGRESSANRERQMAVNSERPSSESRERRPLSANRRDDARQRSRSRERPSSFSRQRETEHRTHSAARPAGLTESTPAGKFATHNSPRDARPGAVREQERTAEQKHLDRQARLRALRETSDARAAANEPRGPLGGGSGRVVQLIRSGSRGDASRPAGRAAGGGLLDSILGSSKQLAKATSRVDLASARRDHTA